MKPCHICLLSFSVSRPAMHCFMGLLGYIYIILRVLHCEFKRIQLIFPTLVLAPVSMSLFSHQAFQKPTLPMTQVSSLIISLVGMQERLISSDLVHLGSQFHCSPCRDAFFGNPYSVLVTEGRIMHNIIQSPNISTNILAQYVLK